MKRRLRPRMRGRGTQPALASVTISGPYNVKGPGDTPSRRRIFVCRPASAQSGAIGADELACATQILSTLVRRAYRRPATDADVQRLLPFYTAGRAEGGFDRGIQRALERVLVSPQFLFRIEREPPDVAPGTPYRISDLELASRLSFFLWSSIPDDELLDAAAAGQLKNPAVLEQQVRRMLADPRSESMVTNFAAQWLYLRDIDAKQPDELLFPDFDETLRGAFHRETELFLDSILRENRSVLELLTANYTFVNERLAKHYGIPNVQGSDFRRVTLPGRQPARRTAGPGQHPDADLLCDANLAGPARQMGARQPAGVAAAAAAAEHSGAEDGRRGTGQDADDARGDDPAPRQSGLRELPCADGSDRLRDGEFRRRRQVARPRWRAARIDASGVLPGGTDVRRHGRPEERAAGASRGVRLGGDREAVDVCARPQPAVLRRAGGARRSSATRRATNYTLSSLVAGVVKSVPFQMREQN